MRSLFWQKCDCQVRVHWSWEWRVGGLEAQGLWKIQWDKGENRQQQRGYLGWSFSPPPTYLVVTHLGSRPIRCLQGWGSSLVAALIAPLQGATCLWHLPLWSEQGGRQQKSDPQQCIRLHWLETVIYPGWEPACQSPSLSSSSHFHLTLWLLGGKENAGRVCPSAHFPTRPVPSHLCLLPPHPLPLNQSQESDSWESYAHTPYLLLGKWTVVWV